MSTLLLLNNKNNNNNKNPHLNFLKGTVLGDKEQGLGIRDKEEGSRDKTLVKFDTEDQVLLYSVVHESIFSFTMFDAGCMQGTGDFIERFTS